MTEKVRCKNCHTTYHDKESIEMAKKWIEKGYAPCPIINCPGELEVVEEATK